MACLRRAALSQTNPSDPRKGADMTGSHHSPLQRPAFLQMVGSRGHSRGRPGRPGVNCITPASRAFHPKFISGLPVDVQEATTAPSVPTMPLVSRVHFQEEDPDAAR